MTTTITSRTIEIKISINDAIEGKYGTTTVAVQTITADAGAATLAVAGQVKLALDTMLRSATKLIGTVAVPEEESDVEDDIEAELDV